MDLDQIRAVPIAAILDLMGVPHRAGKALCPLHSERHPSFSFTDNLFNCFGCGAKGDTIGFIQLHKGVDFMSAVKIVADVAGIPCDGVIKRNYEREALLENKKAILNVLEKEEMDLINELRALFIKDEKTSREYTRELWIDARLEEIRECHLELG